VTYDVAMPTATLMRSEPVPGVRSRLASAQQPIRHCCHMLRYAAKDLAVGKGSLAHFVLEKSLVLVYSAFCKSVGTNDSRYNASSPPLGQVRNA
jgi:hypothetical protein